MYIYISDRKMLPTLLPSRKNKTSLCPPTARSVIDYSRPTNQKHLTFYSQFPLVDPGQTVLPSFSLFPVKASFPSLFSGFSMICQSSHIPNCNSSFNSQINFLVLIKITGHYIIKVDKVQQNKGPEKQGDLGYNSNPTANLFVILFSSFNLSDLVLLCDR